MSSVSDYLKKDDLKGRLNSAVNMTSLSDDCSIKDSDGIISVHMKIWNENNYPVTVKMKYNSIEDFEAFVDMMEKLKVIAGYPDYQVQLIPHENYFDIYINGEQVTSGSLTYYSDEVKRKLRNSISDVFGEIRSQSRCVSDLYRQVNDKQDNIDRCMELINTLNQPLPLAEKKKRINFKRIGEFRGLSSVDGYKINWSRIISILNEYAQELRRDKEVALRTAQNKLLKECDEILNAVKSGRSITDNCYDIPMDLPASHYYIILNFLNKLLGMLKEMFQNATSILDYKSSLFDTLASSINDALGCKKETAIEKIAGIKLDSDTQPEDYQPLFDKTIFTVPYANYCKGHFNVEMDKNGDVFKDIQRQQLERLSQAERDALIYYKSSMYRPINKVVAFIRGKGLTLSDVEKDKSLYGEVLDIISGCYDEFIKRKIDMANDDSPFAVKARALAKQNKIPAVERLFGKYPDKTPELRDYTDIVLSSIPLLESALSKVEIPEDIVVYRGTTKGTALVSDGRFLSTTCSLRVASEFLNESDRVEAVQHNNLQIYQITIPKGSPLIVFTDDMFLDEYREGRVFGEEQAEVLIDPFNFDFKFKYGNSEYNGAGVLVARSNYVAIFKQNNNVVSKAA